MLPVVDYACMEVVVNIRKVWRKCKRQTTHNRTLHGQPCSVVSAGHNPILRNVLRLRAVLPGCLTALIYDCIRPTVGLAHRTVLAM